jgi:hypothetical protein
MWDIREKVWVNFSFNLWVIYLIEEMDNKSMLEVNKYLSEMVFAAETLK